MIGRLFKWFFVLTILVIAVIGFVLPMVFSTDKGSGASRQDRRRVRPSRRLARQAQDRLVLQLGRARGARHQEPRRVPGGLRHQGRLPRDRLEHEGVAQQEGRGQGRRQRTRRAHHPQGRQDQPRRYGEARQGRSAAGREPGSRARRESRPRDPELAPDHRRPRQERKARARRRRRDDAVHETARAKPRPACRFASTRSNATR